MVSPLLQPERLQAIVDALNTRGADLDCPRCKNENFQIAGETAVPLNWTPHNQEPTPYIQVVIVVCSKCGYLAHHALGSLGLLPGTGA